MTLREHFLANNGGDVDAAMVEMVSELMAGDPDRFKRGFTETNAVLAVADTFDVSAEEAQRAVDKAKADELTLDLERRRRGHRLAARVLNRGGD